MSMSGQVHFRHARPYPQGRAGLGGMPEKSLLYRNLYSIQLFPASAEKNANPADTQQTHRRRFGNTGYIFPCVAQKELVGGLGGRFGSYV